MWRWQLTPTSGIRWFWEPIGPLLKFYWEFCVRMPPGEKKSRAGRRPCARGRLSRARWGGTGGSERDREVDPHGAWWFPPGAVSGRVPEKCVWAGPFHWRPASPARTAPFLSYLKDRLYRVTQDAQSKQDTTQLLVPKSRREMLFQAAHCNPMAGHLGQATTLNRLMARFFWPGIHENVRRWCAACRECQLVNPRPPQKRLCAPFR